MAAVRVAPIVRGVGALAPLRWVLRILIGLTNILVPGKARKEGPSVSEDELLALAGVAAEDAVIDSAERALIESIIEFGDTIAREVMVPRTDMVTVGQDFRIDAAMEVAIAHGFSRLPAYGEGGVDEIIGIVYAKDLMRAERDGHTEEPIAELLRPARFVPETKKVAELLREMQTEQFHIAIVIDEYGGTAGLVTLEDLIEELVGEIHDEFDVEEPMVEPAAGGGIRVHARMAVDEVNDLLDGRAARGGDWDTRRRPRATTCSATSPPRGSRSRSRATACRPRRSRAGASAGSGSPRCRGRPARATRAGSTSTGCRPDEVRLRRHRGPAQRGQVHAAEHDPRPEGGDHVADKPQTTRSQVRGVLDRTGPEGEPIQIVFVDTPGIHKPRSPHRATGSTPPPVRPSATSTWPA